MNAEIGADAITTVSDGEDAIEEVDDSPTLVQSRIHDYFEARGQDKDSAGRPHISGGAATAIVGGYGPWQHLLSRELSGLAHRAGWGNSSSTSYNADLWLLRQSLKHLRTVPIHLRNPPQQQHRVPTTARVTTLQADRCGVLLAAGAADGSLRLWDADSLASSFQDVRNAMAPRSAATLTTIPTVLPLLQLKLPGPVDCLQWHPRRDNDMLLSLGAKPELQYHDLSRRNASQPVITLSRGAASAPVGAPAASARNTCCAFADTEGGAAAAASSRGVCVFSGDSSGRVRLWDVRSKQPLAWTLEVASSLRKYAAARASVPPEAARQGRDVNSSSSGSRTSVMMSQGFVDSDAAARSSSLDPQDEHWGVTVSTLSPLAAPLHTQPPAIPQRTSYGGIRTVCGGAEPRLFHAVTSEGAVVTWDLRQLGRVDLMTTARVPTAVSAWEAVEAGGGAAGLRRPLVVQCVVPPSASRPSHLALILRDGRVLSADAMDGTLEHVAPPRYPPGVNAEATVLGGAGGCLLPGMPAGCPVLCAPLQLHQLQPAINTTANARAWGITGASLAEPEFPRGIAGPLQRNSQLGERADDARPLQHVVALQPLLRWPRPGGVDALKVDAGRGRRGAPREPSTPSFAIALESEITAIAAFPGWGAAVACGSVDGDVSIIAPWRPAG